MTNTQHSDHWHDRIQDAIDGSSREVDAELRAHIDGCQQCRTEFEKLSGIHERLRHEFENAPKLGADFSTNLFARIESQDEQQRAAKLHAERQFRRRAEAFALDWRGLFQRHVGSVVATVTIAGALIAALSSTLNGMQGWLRTEFGNLPWISSVFGLPVSIALVSASVAGATIWWLQSKAH